MVSLLVCGDCEPVGRLERRSHRERISTMNFFLPGHDDPAEAEARYAEIADASQTGLPSVDKRVYSIAFVHDGIDYVATVGAPRQATKWRRKRNGRRDETREPSHYASGGVVLAIFESEPFLVFEVPGRSEWANPALVGRSSISSVEYFEARH
jgi:hypothetical protein